MTQLSFKNLTNIIPLKKRKKLQFFFIKSLILNILDIISIAYLIPVVVLLLDKNKFYSFINKFNISTELITDNRIIYFLIVLLLFYIIKNTLHIKYNNSLYDFLYGLSSDISDKIVKDYLVLDYISYQKKSKGKMMHLVMKVAEDFSTKYLHALILLFSEIFILLIIAGFLFYFYPKLTLVSLLILIAFSGFIYLKKKSNFELINSTYNTIQTSANSKLINILDGYLEIKNSLNEDFYSNDFTANNKKLNKVTSKLTSTNFNYSKYLETTLIICLGILIYFNLGSQKNNVLVIATFGALGFRLLPSLSKILTAITHIKSHFYTVKLLNDSFIDKSNTSKNLISTFSSQIKLDNVSFNFIRNKSILENINFTINKGDFIGISGISGIGKTTFLHLIMGLLSPNNGKLIVDDVKIDKPLFFPFIKYMPQQSYLLNGTLLENLTMYRKETIIDYEYLDYLCKKLNLNTLINSLENNYNTIIEHDSLRFSGGQKQRISIARVLYGKPELLIIDEATNQQNKDLEIQIFDLLKNLSKKQNMAIIAVSHNETLTRYFDKTYILKDKKLIALA